MTPGPAQQPATVDDPHLVRRIDLVHPHLVPQHGRAERRSPPRCGYRRRRRRRPPVPSSAGSTRPAAPTPRRRRRPAATGARTTTVAVTSPAPGSAGSCSGAGTPFRLGRRRQPRARQCRRPRPRSRRGLGGIGRHRRHRSRRPRTRPADRTRRRSQQCRGPRRSDEIDLAQGGPVEPPRRGRIVRVRRRRPAPGSRRSASASASSSAFESTSASESTRWAPGARPATGGGGGGRRRGRLPGLAEQLGVLGPALAQGDDLGLEHGDHLVLVPDVVRGTPQHPVDLGHPVARAGPTSKRTAFRSYSVSGPVVRQRARATVRIDRRPGRGRRRRAAVTTP